MARHLVRDDGREITKMVGGAMLDRLAKSGVGPAKVVELASDGSARVVATIGNSTQTDDGAISRVRETLARRARRKILPGQRGNLISRITTGGV